MSTASHTPPVAAIFADRGDGPWLFGKGQDLWAFGGSALLSFALLGAGAALGLLEQDTPEWTWIACVLVIDVAHVWSTAFRVYLDGAEVRRRPLAYLGTPALCYILGVVLYAVGSGVFWTVLAYFAVFHFVRQQYGWVALYRRRARERGDLDRWLDTAAIYAATLYPILWWHAHLPRRFDWMMSGDFIPGLATPLANALEPAYWALLVAFVLRQMWLRIEGRPVNGGKVLVVATTWACWWVGIMALDSDYAFTVTNVFIHAIPYLVLTYRYGKARGHQAPRSALGRILRGGVVAFGAFVVLAAFAEEMLWDRLVWHDRPWLFGEGSSLELPDTTLMLLVPLLALPQLTHYALDGTIWKVRKNPTIKEEL